MDENQYKSISKDLKELLSLTFSLRRLIIKQYKPYRCPVCNGFGTVGKENLCCRGCEGKDWIKINNEDE